MSGHPSRGPEPSPVESAVEACRAIQHFWRRRAINPMQKNLMKRDYLAKARGLSPSDLAELDRAALNLMVPELRFDRSQASAMPNYDVGILTIQPNEWFAVRQVFDLQDKLVGYGPEGQHYYATEIPCKAASGTVRAIFGVVGESLNVPASLATQDLLSRFSIDAIFLLGMAIGVPGKTEIGDVVVARKVVYYEPATVTEHGDRPRDYSAAVPSRMTQMLANFNCDHQEFRDGLELQYRRAPNELMPDSFDYERPVKVNAKRDITSGEKVIENDLLEQIANEKDSLVIAGDQESWGFASAARNHPWLVFRGIADHGKKRSTEQQFSSTVAAAAALQQFIANCYVPSRLLPNS